MGELERFEGDLVGARLIAHAVGTPRYLDAAGGAALAARADEAARRAMLSGEKA